MDVISLRRVCVAVTVGGVSGRCGGVYLSAGPHTVRVDGFNAGGPGNQLLTYQGPDTNNREPKPSALNPRPRTRPELSYLGVRVLEARLNVECRVWGLAFSVEGLWCSGCGGPCRWGGG